MEETSLCMVALLFDSGKINDYSYGEKIFEYIIKGKEVVNNYNKIVVSMGEVFTKEIYNDISPFIIKDELCSIEKSESLFKDRISAVLLEDITFSKAKAIDKRIKNECTAYVGMTTIDINSKDSRKQFWKNLIREYSIEGETITYFGYEEESFFYESTAKKYGFRVNYDGFPDDFDCESKPYLFSTRQSSYIREVSQLEFVQGKSDSSRGILEMNHALVKEVEIAGVQIWKSIEDINRVYISKEGEDIIIDYIFTSLYQAAQGIERLLKIVIELLTYGDEGCDREKINKLLYSHNHVAMCDYLEKANKITLKTREKQLIELLSNFYNSARYNRFSYSEDNTMELKLLREFGREVKTEEFDDKIKHMYGKSIGKISHDIYKLISDLSFKHNIYVYELNSESVAKFVLLSYYSEDLYALLKQIEQSKRELLWYLIKKSPESPLVEYGEKFQELPFQDWGEKEFLHELVCNENSGENIYNFVSNEYDEMVAEDKEKWKRRLEFIEIIGNKKVWVTEDDEEDL